MLIKFLSFKVDSGSGSVSDVASTMMQKFWDSALALEPPDDLDTNRYQFSLIIMMLCNCLIVLIVNLCENFAVKCLHSWLLKGHQTIHL